LALISLDDYLTKQMAAYDAANPAPQIKTGPAPTEQPGFITGPLERGFRGAQSDLTAAGGLLAQGLGFDELSQGLYDKAQEYANARDAIPRRVPRMEDIQDMSDLGVFALETLVENAPLLASIAIPGGIAAKAASIAGAGARAAQATGVISSFLTDVGLQTGESVQIAREGGHDPGDIRVIGAGIGKGLLDFLPMLTIAKRIGLLKGLPLGPVIEREISKTLVNKGFIARAVGEMGTIAAREIPTEVAQEALNIALDRSLNQFHGSLTEDEISQLKNAAAGAAAFSLLGIPAGIARTSADNANPPPDPQEEVNKLLDGSSQLSDREIERFEDEGGGQPIRPPKSYHIGPDGEIREAVDIGVWENEGGPVKSPLLKPGLAAQEPNDLRIAIKRELEQEPTQDRSMLFRPDGSTSVDQAPEALDMMAKASLATPAQWRSWVDNAVIMVNGQVQNGKTRARIAPSTPLAEDPTQGLSDTLKPLMAARDDILANQELRGKRGELTAAGKKQLAAVEARVARSAELSGVSNPVGKTLEDSKDIEKDLEKFNAEASKPKTNLSPGEEEYVTRLEQKEVLNGLTDEEEKTLDALYLKRIQARTFPVMGGPRISWALAEKAHVAFNKEEGGKAQSLEAMADRGGFHAQELDKLVPGWRGRKARKLTAGEIRKLAEAPAVSVREGPGEGDFLTEGVDEGVLRQKKGTQQKPKFNPEQVANAVKQLTANMQNRPTFIVTPNTGIFRGVPNREHLVSERDTTLGMFFMDEPGTVYIFSDRVQSTQQLAKTILHELFHFGFHNYMDTAERNQFLQMVLAAKGEQVMAKIAEFHPELSLARDADPTDVRVIRRMRSALLREAEEVIADLAETNPKDSLLDRVLALFMRVIRRIMPSLKISQAELRALVRDIGAWGKKRSVVTERNYRQISEPFRKREFGKLVGRRNTFENEVLPGIQNWGEVWGQKFLNGVLTPLQMANSKFVKKNLPSAPKYLDFVQEWWARKRNLTSFSVEVADQWSKMSKRDSERLARTIFDVSMASDEKGERLTDQEVMEIMKKNGMDPSEVPTNMGVRTGGRNLFELWHDIDESFQKIVHDMEKGLQTSVIRQAIREKGAVDPATDRLRAESLAKLWRSEPKHTAFFDSVVKSPDLVNMNLGGRLLEIEGQMQRLRNKNYFPRMRFGKYAITIRAKANLSYGGEEIKGPAEGGRGGVVWFETHESPNSQGNRAEELRAVEFRDSSKFEVQTTRLSDNEFVFLGMPPALYETLRSELGLTAEQEEGLKEIYRKFSPGSAFLKHLIRRKDIAGFSTDAIRIYASYMMNAANHLARVEYHQDLGDSLNNIRRESNLPVNATRAGEVREYFARHFQYLMNPGNDWARLRSLGFLWYLGFNAKSALVNLTQIPMVAYPFLATRYGDKAAIGSIAKATSDVAKMRRGRKVLDVEADRDLARALKDGFIDESRATELAGLAEGDILQSLMPEGASGKIINKVSYYGAFLFRHTEKINREIVFLAARELAIQRGLKGDQVYRAAREAVQTTMFEYAKWNRPEYTRGKKSVFFLFTNYIQHLSYLAYGGEGGKVAMRIWLGLMLAAGAQGLPFAENFFDIFDWGSTTVKEMLGSKDPKTEIREDIRRLASTITDEPDLIMHGLARYYGLGPLHFMQLFGVPVPHVDISSSLGAGEVIPGMREAFAANDDPDAKLGKVMIDAMGPVVGIGYNLWRASGDQNPDTWKVWERAMPSAISAVSKSFRRPAAGGETFRGGGKLIEFEPQNMEHRMENIAQAFGFGPTRLAQRQELRYSQQQLQRYWVSRQAALMESYAYAMLARDPEAVDLAKKKIREYNKAVPSRVLAISHDSLTASLRERFRRATLREYGIPSENKFRALYRRTEQQFPEGAAAIPERTPYQPQ